MNDIGEMGDFLSYLRDMNNGRSSISRISEKE